ncbi:MAG: anthranilate phosphoribosyltransferase [Pirellulaceae bacterium]
MMQAILQQVGAGENLSMEQVTEVFDVIMRGEAERDQIAQLLMALRAKGETVDEVAGAALALRRHMATIRTTRENLIDTCGTGGGGGGTFNISTAAALVAAGAGAAVAKHGNRRMTSKSGSADALSALGVNIEAPLETVERCLDEVGLCFCFAPLHHQSMRHVAEVRRELGVPTIFNLLGPLCNPARAPFQLLGVGRPETRQLLAAALAKLGTRRSAVVCGADGLGEVTLAGETHVTQVTDEGLQELVWTPRDFALESSSRDALLAEDPQASAAIIRGVLAGEKGPPRDIVIANSAAALWIAGHGESLAACARQSAESIDSGAAAEVLRRLAEVSHA